MSVTQDIYYEFSAHIGAYTEISYNKMNNVGKSSKCKITTKKKKRQKQCKHTHTHTHTHTQKKHIHIHGLYDIVKIIYQKSV